VDEAGPSTAVQVTFNVSYIPCARKFRAWCFGSLFLGSVLSRLLDFQRTLDVFHFADIVLKPSSRGWRGV